MNNRYYIGGKQYSPAESVMLCQHVEGFTASATLYRTEKGAFFIVEADAQFSVSVRVVDQEVAFAFMDAHPAGICIESYNRIFGEPERG